MKMRLIVRAVATLATLTGCYWLYSLFAVPLIEPTLRAEQLVVSTDHELLKARPSDRYRHLLEPLCLPNSWELEHPMVLRNKETMLLLDDYEILEDRCHLKLARCTLIFNPQGLEEGNFSHRTTGANSPTVLVVRPEDGALIQFDQPFDIRSGSIGHIETAQLKGRVHIVNPLAAADASNRINIVTSDVQLSTAGLSTFMDVDFQIGPVAGRGRHLEFSLQSEDDAELRRLPGITEMGFGAVELVHLERLRIQLPPEWLSTSPFSVSGDSAPPEVAIDVISDGPMKLDISAGLATVEKNVVLRRLRADGGDDHVYCQLLSLYFDLPAAPVDPGTELGPSRKQDVIPKLQLNRVVALGNPAVASFSAHSINEMGGNRGKATLSATDVKRDESLRGRYHAEAVRFDYHLATDGRLGTFRAVGPGKFRSTADQEGTGYFEVAWDKELSVTPDEEFHLLSLVGNGHIEAERLGKLRADILHLWLRDSRERKRTSHPNSAQAIYPDRAQAEGGVRVQSQQLSGHTDLLKVWFKYPSPEESSQDDSPNELGLTTAEGEHYSATNNVSTTGLHVQGEELRILVKAGRDVIGLEEVTLKGRVQCVETNIAATETQPLQMSGELFRLRQFTARGGSARIEGFPAHIRARGISLSGPTIEMDRQANRLWIDGGGTATLPLPDDMAARYSRRETSAEVTWSGNFDFDGSRLQCTRQVEIRGPAQSIQTEALALTLTQPVQLSDPRAPWDEIGVEEINAQGNVQLENHSFDERGLVTIDKMLVHDLTINQISGEITGLGPGWIHSVREGRRLGQFGHQNPADDSKVTLLHVDFQRGIHGNLHRRDLLFFDQVKAVYGFADDWNQLSGSTNRQSIPDGGVVLHCQQLKLLQMAGGNAASDSPVEMIATGNTAVEGRTFSARAHRISYAQAKGQLVIEGDGRTDAELWRQNSPNGPAAKSVGRKLLYWPDSNRLSGGDWKSVELEF